MPNEIDTAKVRSSAEAKLTAFATSTNHSRYTGRLLADGAATVYVNTKPNKEFTLSHSDPQLKAVCFTMPRGVAYKLHILRKVEGGWERYNFTLKVEGDTYTWEPSRS